MSEFFMRESGQNMPKSQSTIKKTKSVVTALEWGLAQSGSNMKELGYMVLQGEDTETREYSQTSDGTISKISLSFIQHQCNNLEFIMCCYIQCIILHPQPHCKKCRQYHHPKEQRSSFQIINEGIKVQRGIFLVYNLLVY